MSFDKHYPNRKDRRKQYHRRAERNDMTCRPHGGCPYCKNNRLHTHKKKEKFADADIDNADDVWYDGDESTG